MIIQPQTRVQAKCNFCFQWIYGDNLSTKLKNICTECLQKALNEQFLLRSMQRDEYQIILINKYLKDENTSCDNKGALLEIANELFSLELKEVIEKWDDAKRAIFQKDTISSQQKNAIQTYLQEAAEQSSSFHNNQNLDSNVISKLSMHARYSEPLKMVKKKKLLSHSELIQRLSLNQEEELPMIPFREGELTFRSPFEGELTQLRSPLSDLSFNGLFSKQKPSLNTSRTTSYSFHFDHQAHAAFRQNQKSKLTQCIQQTQKKPRHIRTRTHFQKFAEEDTYYDEDSIFIKDDAKNRIMTFLQEKYQSKTFNRLMAVSIKTAFDSTKATQETLELISFAIGQIDLQIYLKLFDFKELKRVKLVNVGFTNTQFKILLDFIQDKQVETLVLTCNKLTEDGLHALSSFEGSSLQEIYLGKNRIYKYRARPIISQLRKRFRMYL